MVCPLFAPALIKFSGDGLEKIKIVESYDDDLENSHLSCRSGKKLIYCEKILLFLNAPIVKFRYSLVCINIFY